MSNADDQNSKSHTNRLINESSPYLLQHAHNPVDWFAWGPEAFEKARKENKPIFLSVGYSTCYWCHVMERQCFENEAVAAEMNRLCVNIKVDREERPDVDQLYMTAVQLITRHGGWPMSVWLTPDLKPFYGGTYFPPDKFVAYLRALDDTFQNRSDEVAKTSGQLVSIIERLAQPIAPERTLRVDEELIDDLVRRSMSDYEPRHGGFGAAPKFPRETLLEMLLTYLANASTRKTLPLDRPRRTIANRKFSPSSCTRSMRWRRGGFVITWAADSIGIQPTPNGLCRTSRSCCTTTRCSGGSMPRRTARPGSRGMPGGARDIRLRAARDDVAAGSFLYRV